MDAIGLERMADCLDLDQVGNGFVFAEVEAMEGADGFLECVALGDAVALPLERAHAVCHVVGGVGARLLAHFLRQVFEERSGAGARAAKEGCAVAGVSELGASLPFSLGNGGFHARCAVFAEGCVVEGAGDSDEGCVSAHVFMNYKLLSLR